MKDIRAVSALTVTDTVAVQRFLFPGGPPPLDPATLTLTGWWRTDYTAPGSDPRWVGTASVGTSGSHDLIQNLNVDPVATVGTALNGHDPASYASGQSLETFDTFDNFCGADGTIAMLVYLPSSSAAVTSGDPTTDPCVANDRNNFMHMAESTSGFQPAIYDGANQTFTPITHSFDAWHLLQMRWTSGGAMEGRVDSGAWSSVAIGTVNITASGLVFAKNPGVAFCPMDQAECFIASTALSDGNMDGLIAYCNDRYGLSL